MVTLPGSFLCDFLMHRFLCADFIWAARGWFTRSALQRVWLLVGGDNFACLRHTLFFLFFQLVELRLVLLN